MFGSDTMCTTKSTVPNPAPDASEPRQAHPICSVLFESHDDHAKSWLVHLNHVVIMWHARYLPVNDVITSKNPVDVFLRYWCPDYPDSGGIGCQRSYSRSNCRNCKSGKLVCLEIAQRWPDTLATTVWFCCWSFERQPLPISYFCRLATSRLLRRSREKRLTDKTDFEKVYYFCCFAKNCNLYNTYANKTFSSLYL